MKMRKFLMEYFEPFVGAPVAMKVFQVIAWFCIVYIGITTPILHGYSPVELAMIAIVFIAMTLIAVVAIMSFFWAKEKEDKKPLIFVTIDGDLDPYIPPGFRLAGEGTEHMKMGKITLEKFANDKLYVNGIEVIRYLSPNQKNGKHINGHSLSEELKDKQVLNACVMDALLANPRLIPNKWKSGYTYFWGTILSDGPNSLFAECMAYDNYGWRRCCFWLNAKWRRDELAAVLNG